MAKSVHLTTQRQVPLDDIVEALRDAGATNVQVDRRSGDPYAGVDKYFYIEFDDAKGAQVHRTAFGFTASIQETHENGWTRFQLGSDARGRHFVEAVAEACRGCLHDDVSGMTMDFDEVLAPAYA